MNIRLQDTATPLSTPSMGVQSSPKLLDKINALISKIIAYFISAPAVSEEMPVLEIKDPFTKLLEIQARLSGPEPDFEACLKDLAKIEAALPSYEKRDKTDRCIADTVEAILVKPQDAAKARFAEAEAAMEEQAQILVQGQERKGRFVSAQETMEGLGEELVRRRNFLSSKQALEELGPALFTTKEQIAREAKAKAKRFAKAKAHLEKRGQRLLRGQQKRMEGAALAPHAEEFAYSAIANAQLAYKQAKQSLYTLMSKTSRVKATVALVESQLEYLESQTIAQKARRGLSEVQFQAKLLKLKFLGKGKGEKAERAREELATYESLPKGETSLERRNKHFTAAIDAAKAEHKVILEELKARLKASDLPEEEQLQTLAEQKALFNESIRSLLEYAKHVSQSKLYEASGEKRLVTVSKSTLEAYLVERKAALREARAKEANALGYLSLEGKSVKDLKVEKGMAYIGAEYSALKAVGSNIKYLKKYNRRLAKYLEQTPVLDIEVK